MNSCRALMKLRLNSLATCPLLRKKGVSAKFAPPSKRDDSVHYNSHVLAILKTPFKSTPTQCYFWAKLLSIDPSFPIVLSIVKYIWLCHLSAYSRGRLSRFFCLTCILLYVVASFRSATVIYGLYAHLCSWYIYYRTILLTALVFV